jgi:methylamine dehydrogenase heavy chain
MAYSSANQVLFVLMHAGAFDGSHKNGAEEIWAVDLRRRAVLYRSNAEGETHIAVTQDRAAPILFTSNSHEGGLSRYEVDPAARFAARRTNHVDLASAGYVVAP